MDWTRGDAHYGPDFIALSAPCQNVECRCVAEFKAIRSKDFADYVASLPHGMVPVVFNVVRSSDGHVAAATLSSAGDWTRDKFPSANDGLLTIQYSFKPAKPGEHPAAKRYDLKDCFPTNQ